MCEIIRSMGNVPSMYPSNDTPYLRQYRIIQDLYITSGLNCQQSKRPPHHCHHTSPVIQEFHLHSQAITGVIVFVLIGLNKQRHLIHERTVFLAAVGIINEIELFMSGTNWIHQVKGFCCMNLYAVFAHPLAGFNSRCLVLTLHSQVKQVLQCFHRLRQFFDFFDHSVSSFELI